MRPYRDARRVARLTALSNRGNPLVHVNDGGGKMRGAGVTKKRKRRRGKRG